MSEANRGFTVTTNIGGKQFQPTAAWQYGPAPSQTPMQAYVGAALERGEHLPGPTRGGPK